MHAAGWVDDEDDVCITSSPRAGTVQETHHEFTTGFTTSNTGQASRAKHPASMSTSAAPVATGEPSVGDVESPGSHDNGGQGAGYSVPKAGSTPTEFGQQYVSDRDKMEFVKNINKKIVQRLKTMVQKQGNKDAELSLVPLCAEREKVRSTMSSEQQKELRTPPLSPTCMQILPHTTS